jgi:putative transposase
VLSELKNRGVNDALIVCCDGLNGLPEAVQAVWPSADVQTCVVHYAERRIMWSREVERLPLAEVGGRLSA